MSYNRLETVPIEVFQLQALEVLDLSHNSLEMLPPYSQSGARHAGFEVVPNRGVCAIHVCVWPVHYRFTQCQVAVLKVASL